MEPEKTRAARPHPRTASATTSALGLIGFGGPVALVGQMERELVGERKWLTKEEMREGIAVCQSLPGPLAIQVGIWISYIRGGFWGAWAGGWAFILPQLRHRHRARRPLHPLRRPLRGEGHLLRREPGGDRASSCTPCYRLTKLGMKDWLEWALAAGGLRHHGRRCRPRSRCSSSAAASSACSTTARSSANATASSTTTSLCRRCPARRGRRRPGISGAMLGKLFAFFLKAGSLTFGSGLVIVPFLEKGLVQQTGWLTEREFLVAVAMGMISPGPVVITATFVGYLVAGFWGAVVATDRHLPAVVPAHPHRGARSSCATARTRTCRASSRAPTRRPSAPFSAPASCSGKNRHRRLAHRPRCPGQPRRPVPLEGQQLRSWSPPRPSSGSIAFPLLKTRMDLVK